MDFYLQKCIGKTSIAPTCDIDYTMAELVIKNFEVIEGEMRENKVCDDLRNITEV